MEGFADHLLHEFALSNRFACSYGPIHDDIGANLRALTDDDPPQYFCPGSQKDILFDYRIAIGPPLRAVSAYRNTVEYDCAALYDRRSDDCAKAMQNVDTPFDPCSVVDFDRVENMNRSAKQEGECRNPALPEPMGNAVNE